MPPLLEYCLAAITSLAIPFACSAASVTVTPGQPVVIRTAKAEFHISPEGYCSAYLLDGSAKLTLDDPTGGKPLVFTTDLARVEVTDTGTGGKRVTIPARAIAPGGASIERVTVIETYDDIPDMLLERVTYKNSGANPVTLGEVRTAQHRLNAHLLDAKAAPYELWSFDGASEKWGQDDVLAIPRHFSRQNRLGAALANGYGGGVPLVAFWTARAGIAIGHLDTQPVTARLPVQVDDTERIRAGLVFDTGGTIEPGATYALHKWIDIYHSKMLSRGEFLNLYTVGYDMPEGYVIQKNKAMYYAFYTPFPDDSWKGELELRGLAPGKYRVLDYPDNKDLGVIDASNPHMPAAFTGSLLLEVTREP